MRRVLCLAGAGSMSLVFGLAAGEGSWLCAVAAAAMVGQWLNLYREA